MRDLVFVGLGANLFDPLSTVLRLIEAIRLLDGVSHLRSSSLYETSPVSSIEQPNFVNGVVSFRSTIPPLALLFQLQSLEKRFGKVPKAKDAPRPCDLDLLFYRGEQVHLPRLTIPHPKWMERLFVTVPLSDLTDFVSWGKGPFFRSIKLQPVIESLRQTRGDWVQKLPYLSPLIKE